MTLAGAPAVFLLQRVDTVSRYQYTQKNLSPAIVTIGKDRQPEGDPEYGENDEPFGAFKMHVPVVLYDDDQRYQYGHQDGEGYGNMEGNEKRKKRDSH